MLGSAGDSRPSPGGGCWSRTWGSGRQTLRSCRTMTQSKRGSDSFHVGEGGDLGKLPGGVGSPRAASPPASRVFRPPPPRACREGERSRQQSLCVTKDSTFGLVQGGRGVVKNRGSLALGAGRKPHVAHRTSGAGARNSSARYPLLPQAPPPQTLRSLCPRAPRIAPSSCPGKGKLGQLSWKRACEQKDF